MNFQNGDVKSAAIHVLARARDEMANRLLAGFLNDPDEEIRIQAAIALDPGQGGARVKQILREASAREFQAKSLKEKEALLSFLGRTRSAEALEFLSRTLLKAPLLGSKRRLELRLAAVAGLESMGTEEALDALRKGAIGRPQKVREACAASLARRPAAGPSKGLG
jgi:HEAT repeat protein